MKQIIEQAKSSHSLAKQEIVTLLSENSFDDFLFKSANEVRHKFVGDEIHLRGLIEFSNICKCNCKYCGLRKDNSDIERYFIDTEKLYELAQKAKDYGYKTVVMQSGENSCYNKEEFCKLISKIKTLDMAITLSIGEKSFEEYKAYKDAGADRYLIRIETTDKELYKKMHPNMDFENRVRCLKDLKTLGYEVGTGCLVGLPNQSIESLADDILFFKKIDADMIGIGPFIPNPNTPLAEMKGGDLTLALKVMAITRLLLPTINIPATTAMETLNPNGRIIALQSGANVVMPNITEEFYRQKYEIYPKDDEHITPIKYRQLLSEKFASIGRSISKDYGFHKRD